MKFKNLHRIAAAIAAGDFPKACAAIPPALAQHVKQKKAEHRARCAKLDALARKRGEEMAPYSIYYGAQITASNWHRDLGKLARTLTDGVPRFTINKADGNKKLPFPCFSSLPGVGFCPGAGECLRFCYSFRAWRYPAAFARQAQNAYLLQTAAGRTLILQDLDKFARHAAKTETGQIDFRLYVDGDFGSVDHVRFWQYALIARPWLKAYGYSKSWAELLAYADSGEPFAPNYRLNLSSGSIHGADMRARILTLPIARGDFITVPMAYKVTSAMHGEREHQARLREAFGAKAFTCPGLCGSCTPKGHACGSDRFRGVPIIIAVH